MSASETAARASVEEHPSAGGHDPSVFAYVRDPAMAREYDRFHAYNRLFDTDTRFLGELLESGLVPEKAKVLDIGCGTGRHLVFLASRGCEVTGIDLSEHMLREAAKKLDRHGHVARLVKGDMCRVGETGAFRKSEFDAAVCMFSTLGLLRGAALRRKAIRGWRKVLKPDGLLVVHAHNLWHNLTDGPGRSWLVKSFFLSMLPGRELGDKIMRGYRGLDRLYLHIFSLRELRSLLRGAGLRIERELLLNGPRTGPFEGRLAYFRANGFLIAARPATVEGRGG